MSSPKAIIAEDEPVLGEVLKEMLADVWPELTICAEASDGVQALRALEAHAPDILFLDIEMPGMSGLEVAHQASGRCHVVFVTAHNDYAVAAFEEGSVDYVLKPLSMARIATTVARLKQRMQGAPARLDGLLQVLNSGAPGKKEYLRRITASQGNNIRLINIEDVCYFQADNKYTLVVTADSEWLIRRALRDLIEEIDPDVFWQIHRSTIVNVNAIGGITRDETGHLHIRLKQRKETLLVSGTYAHLFKQM
jgi:DNA-binding LytR/AlgR family response regulator